MPATQLFLKSMQPLSASHELFYNDGNQPLIALISISQCFVSVTIGQYDTDYYDFPVYGRRKRQPYFAVEGIWPILHDRQQKYALFNVLVNYPNLKKNIWPAPGDLVSGSSRNPYHRDEAMPLLEEYELYSTFVKTLDGRSWGTTLFADASAT